LFGCGVGNAEIKAMEPRLAIKIESLHAILDEVAQSDARAKKVKPRELVDVISTKWKRVGSWIDYGRRGRS
jgi:hypothetical protein